MPLWINPFRYADYISGTPFYVWSGINFGRNKIAMEIDVNSRKREEAAFHNELRSESLKEEQSRYKYLTSNKKYYSIVRKSHVFVDRWLRQRCCGKRALDYCCGNGENAIFMAKNGAESTGIDISDVSIENCKKNAIREGVSNSTSFLVMDAENMKFEDNHFDVVVCSGVLHHLDIGKAFRELARIVTPSGEIICIEPLRYNPLIQLYRRMTPHLRTQWEMEHILTMRDLEGAKKYFGKTESNFFHLFTLLAVPFRNSYVFNSLLGIFEGIDSALLRLPFLKLMAWQVVFILSRPKKF